MPAARWTNVGSFFALFPRETSVGSAVMNDALLPMAERWVEGRLGSRFTVPFSGFHLGAVDLAYAKAYHLIRLRTLAPGDSDEMGRDLDKQITMLLDGDAALMTDSGPVFAEVTDTSNATRPFSAISDFTPVFGLDEAGEQEVDPDYIEERRNDRG